ncbi:unnamed protein product [Owenia fusiformis]|uniref:Uncharacterized protein n=1 Tax=Owenia fusiformis TaxID=6347 RepID=A0A8J1TUI2_OWEFU|nr:unnamed protein product [Owenia fusiformis]
MCVRIEIQTKKKKQIQSAMSTTTKSSPGVLPNELNSTELIATLATLTKTLTSLEQTIQEQTILTGQLIKRKHVHSGKEIHNKDPLKQSTFQKLDKKVIVHVKVVFLKIGEIDTIKEQFNTDAFIQARWREPALDDICPKEIDKIDLEQYFNPGIFVDNAIGDLKEDVWHLIEFDEKKQAFLLEKRRVKGLLLENLELKDFPFDTQDLTLTLTSELPESDLEILPDPNELSSINVKSFVDEQEWHLHDHVETRTKITTSEYSSAKHKHCSLSITARASRRPAFYVWNILVMMLFISGLIFSTFAIPTSQIAVRLKLAFTLVLTAVTFKFVVNQSLPKIPYLTYLDRYVLTSMGFLCIISIWHSVLAFLHSDDNVVQTVDGYGLLAFGILYTLFQILYYLFVYVATLYKRQKMVRLDKKHKIRLAIQDQRKTASLCFDNHARVKTETILASPKRTPKPRTSLPGISR